MVLLYRTIPKTPGRFVSYLNPQNTEKNLEKLTANNE